MECTRIRELISDYIDGTLDAEAKAAVEEHISACTGCKEELASIRALVDELGSLEPVRAPGDLLEKIHERMDLGYGIHRIVRKLFVPFRIKVPLEFAGAVVVAILVVAVFLNTQQTEEKVAKIPTVSIQARDVPKPPVDRLEKDLKQEAKRTAPVLEEPREKRSGLSEAWVTQKSSEVPMRSAVAEEFEPSPAVSERPKAGKSVGAHEPVELVLVLKREFIARTQFQRELRSEIREVPDTSTDEEARPPLPSSEGEMMSSLGQRVIHLIGLEKGKVLDVRVDTQTGQVNTINAEIPANRYESFTEGLSRSGTLRTTPPDLSAKDRETVHIRIHLESSE